MLVLSAFAALSFIGEPAVVPAGTYHGVKTILGEHIDGTIKIDDTTHFDLTIAGAASIKCGNESYTFTDNKIDVTHVGDKGDCIHDQLEKNKLKLDSVEFDASKNQLSIHVKKSASSMIGLSS